MIVVTGGAGFIGSVLVARLNEIGKKDLIVVDEEAKNSPKWKNLAQREFRDYYDSLEFVHDLEAGKFDGRVSAIFHLGACSDTTETDADYLRRNNTEYTQRLASWSLRHKVYFQYASSAATYGGGELGFSDADSLTPRLKPLNLYGQSKLEFDKWVLKNGYENRFVGFRFFNVYGPNEYHKAGMRSMVQKGYEQIRDTGKIKLFKSYKKEYADGGQMRDFVYVKDIVKAMLWFYENPSKAGIFNLGRGTSQSWNDLAAALFKAMGKTPSIEYVEMPDELKNQYQYYTEAELSKLRGAGCSTAFRDLEAGVGDYVRLHLSQPDPAL
jgi:ADP-L-glycero-D-manno-heptose 6-epimerase